MPVRRMLLSELAALVPGARMLGPDTKIRGIQYDSRRVEGGDLFVCIRGFRQDGHRYLSEAIRRGAIACMSEDESWVPTGFSALVVDDSRKAMAPLSQSFYGKPSDRLGLVGVTGTNGKTTTAYLCRAVLRELGSIGLIGTVQNVVGDDVLPVERTTPEAPDLARLFSLMLMSGNHGAVMEVSSHSLELHRVDEVNFDVAVFTNLSQDHLDFHGDFEHYFAAKRMLFERLQPTESRTTTAQEKSWSKWAVINVDDPRAESLIAASKVPVMTYGLSEHAHVRAENIQILPEGARFECLFPGGRQPLQLCLTGRFNVYNALAAFAVGLSQELSPSAIAERLGKVSAVPGRFERIPSSQPFSVIVDYAHTPDGLENVLKTARELTRGRVIAVFGAGGDRDRSKRPLMGELAGRLADCSILTSDNPRSEDPEAILAEIEEGVRRAHRGEYHLEPDREQAIRLAVRLAQPGDVVLIAGKGHETYQIFHDQTIYFDDREVAGRILRELDHRQHTHARD